MKERPILFSTEMVRAILEGRKTQTRRVIKPQPNDIRESPFVKSGIEDTHGYEIKRKYAPGDRLWVRETWSYSIRAMAAMKDEDGPFVYRAGSWGEDERIDGVWHPSIFMPRWASRITLEVVSVRVERVQDISINDSLREGYPNHGNDGAKWGFRPIVWFAELWNSINAKRGYGWDVNPWVWVIEFKVLP